VLERLERTPFSRLTLDFDGSVLSTKGHVEGSAAGINKVKKGARSCYPSSTGPLPPPRSKSSGTRCTKRTCRRAPKRQTDIKTPVKSRQGME